MTDKVLSKSLEIISSGTKKGKKEKRYNDASLKNCELNVTLTLDVNRLILFIK